MSEASVDPGTLRIFSGGLPQDTRVAVWSGTAWLDAPAVRKLDWSFEAGGTARLVLTMDLIGLASAEMFVPKQHIALITLGVTPTMLRAARIALWWEMQKARFSRVRNLWR